jgi:hypothetical protein
MWQAYGDHNDDDLRSLASLCDRVNKTWGKNEEDVGAITNGVVDEGWEHGKMHA